MTIPYMKVASWCSYWQLVVKVSREKQAVRWLVTVEAEVIMAKEEKSDNGRKTWGKAIFFSILHPIFFPFKPRNSPLFIMVEDEYFIFNNVKSWSLIQLERISTIGLKL